MNEHTFKSLRFCLLAGLFLGWACGPGEAPDGGTPAPAPETVVVAIFADIRDVNEILAPATPIHTALHNFILFLPLLDEQADFEKGPPSFGPRLAESWEFSDDREALTFHLDPDIVWSDGVPVTAEDVRWTWQLQTNPDLGWVGFESKKHIRDVEVVDEHTVRFHFTQVSPSQLLDAIQGVVLPRHAWSRLPLDQWRESSEWFFDNLVVNGPFTLESWEPGQRVVVVANERYFEPGLPKVKRVVLRVTPEREIQLALLRSGEAQMIEWARPADTAALAEDPDIALDGYIQRGIQALSWNTQYPLFTSAKVRRALAMGIDRQAIVDATYYGYAKISSSPYTSNLWTHNTDLEPLPYDPERAREMLAEEGWSDTDGDGVLDRDGQPFRFEIRTPAGNELRQDILVMVQDHLTRIGVDARQRSIEPNTQLAREFEHDYEASFLALGFGTNLDLSFFFHSEAATTGYNFGSYANPEVDSLLEEIQREMDPLAAKPLYDRLQVILQEDQPLTFMYEPRRMVPHHKTLQGVEPNSVSLYHNIRHWVLRPE